MEERTYYQAADQDTMDASGVAKNCQTAAARCKLRFIRERYAGDRDEDNLVICWDAFVDSRCSLSGYGKHCGP